MVAFRTDLVRKPWRTFLVSALLPVLAGSASGQATAAPAKKQAAWVALNDEGMALYKAGKPAEAEPVLQRALASAEKELGPNDGKVARVLYGMASVAVAQGKYAEAEPLYLRSISIAEKAYGPDNANLAFVLEGLGWDYAAQGKYAEAEATFGRSLAIADKALKPDDPKLVRILAGYAEALRKTEKVEAAEKLEARARKIGGPAAIATPAVSEKAGHAAEISEAVAAYDKSDPGAAARAAYKKGDYNTAARLFRELADAGDADAQSTMGDLCLHGEGVPKDPVQAVAWYRNAAAQGQVIAEINLGVCYEKGIGVSTDLAEAVRWYRKAAEQGDSNGQRFLGDMYANGFGVAKDRKEAERWYTKAAARGDEKASSLLAVPDSMREGTPKSLMALGMRAVELQDSIFLVRWVIGHPSNLTLSGEKVTAENAPQVLERLERERASVNAQIEISGSRPMAGDYTVEKPAKNPCSTFGGRPLHYPIKATVLQAKNGIEIHGDGLVGCGVIVGNLIVMKTQECTGTSPGRLLAVALDGAIKDLTLYEDIYGNPKDAGCMLGSATRAEAPK